MSKNIINNLDRKEWSQSLFLLRILKNLLAQKKESYSKICVMSLYFTLYSFSGSKIGSIRVVELKNNNIFSHICMLHLSFDGGSEQKNTKPNKYDI